MARLLPITLSTDTAVCYTALYNTLYHTVFLVWVGQASKAVVSSKIFRKTFATCNEWGMVV